MRPPVARSDTQSIPPISHMCQRRHHGECGRYSTGCFQCGQEGHFIKECPQLIGAETSVASLATPHTRDEHSEVFRERFPKQRG